jgi:tetratricopeptide (TPR) repeat protein
MQIIPLAGSPGPGRRRRGVILALALVALAAGASLAQEAGDTLELPALRTVGDEGGPESDAPAEEVELVAPVFCDNAAPGEAAPPADLPRQFFWKSRVHELGRAGFVYLGDYYLVEERNLDLAERAYAYVLDAWPECGPVQLRMDLLRTLAGDWLAAAEAFQVGLDEGLPPVVRRDYGVERDAPLTSSSPADVPPVPAILFRQALEHLRQSPPPRQLVAPWRFLAGRLHAFLGEYEAALRMLQPVAGDDQAAPWHFQAASQCAELYLATWRPEQALASLERAFALVGDHPALVDRLGALVDRLDEPANAACAGAALALVGGTAREIVPVLGSRGPGRWILARPATDFAGPLRVTAPDSAEALDVHVLYRGGDYWLLSLPLGEDGPGWEPGQEVVLEGGVAAR